MRGRKRSTDWEAIGIFSLLGFLIACAVAWVTHIVVCIMQSKFLLLIAGAFVFPVGIIHGFMSWFG